MKSVEFLKGDLKGLAQEIQNRRRIPYGELKLLGLVVLLIASVMFFNWAWVLCQKDPEGLWWFIVQGVSIVGCFASFVICLAKMISTKWFIRFWYNNVLTYYAVFWIEPKSEQVSCCVPGYGQWQDKADWALYIPLGGWFSSRGRIRSFHPGLQKALSYLKMSWSTIIPESDLVYLNLVDRDGTSVPLTIERLMNKLDERISYPTVVRPLNWREEVEDLDERFGRVRLSLNDALLSSERLEVQRDRLLSRLDRLVDQLADTDRLGKSKEGLVLRRGLERDMLELAHADWSRLAYYEVVVARQAHGPSGGQQLEA